MNLFDMQIGTVRIDQKLLAHADMLYNRDRELAGLLPMESLMQEAGRLTVDRGPRDGVAEIVCDNLPDDPNSILKFPRECVRLSFKATEKELLLEFAAISNEGEIVSAIIPLSYERLKRVLQNYQSSMIEKYSGGTRLHIFTQKERVRHYLHDDVVMRLFDFQFGTATTNGRVSILPGTGKNIVSVIGLLFPKGPFETQLKQAKVFVPPVRPGLEYRDGYAFFNAASFRKQF